MDLMASVEKGEFNAESSYAALNRLLDKHGIERIPKHSLNWGPILYDRFRRLDEKIERLEKKVTEYVITRERLVEFLDLFAQGMSIDDEELLEYFCVKQLADR